MTTEQKLLRFVKELAAGDLRKDAPMRGPVYCQGWNDGQNYAQQRAAKLLKGIEKEKPG